LNRERKLIVDIRSSAPETPAFSRFGPQHEKSTARLGRFVDAVIP
jgi:hypothetical protein